MYREVNCPECHYSFPDGQLFCPHCNRPSRFPNIVVAERPEQVAALEKRYQVALADARDRDCEAVLTLFEQRVLEASEAVVCRSVLETLRVVESDRVLFSTYYHLIEDEQVLPRTDEWRRARELADEVLHGSFAKRNIYFAALALGGEGLANYGPCSWVLAERMIDFRTTVFEENSAVFFRKKAIRKADVQTLGYRAVWQRRGKLAACKLGSRLRQKTSESEFANILCKTGKDSGQDDFVEAHVFGSMTYRAIDRIVVRRNRLKPWQVEALEELNQLNLDWR